MFGPDPMAAIPRIGLAKLLSPRNGQQINHMFDKARLKKKATDIKPVALPGNISERDIYQGRYNYGVNVGSCFINEKWIFDELFDDDTSVELQMAKLSLKKRGEDETVLRLDNHWKNFVSDDDWKYLVDRQVTSIRVPIGYWQIGGGQFVKGTQFEGTAKVYKNAWSIFKSHFVDKAAEHGISVLVDVHGLPGGANNSDHSGETETGGKAEFWDNHLVQLRILEAFKFIAKDLKNKDNIAGIQVVNEAEYSSRGKRQKDFYAAAVALIREEDALVPVYISDGWSPQQWAEWVQLKQGDGPLNVVVDHHVYRCFSDDDKNKLAEQIINDLDGDVLTNLPDNSRGVDFIVGEYSCVIDGQSWDKGGDRDELVVRYGQRQSELFGERAAGSYFWTLKFQSGNGGEWDFKTMLDKGALKSPFRGSNAPLKEKFDEVLEREVHAHEDYWNNQSPKEKFEHDRYKEGFTAGWNDSAKFFAFRGSVLGRKQAYKLGRLQEHISKKGSSKYLWEFEQGYDAGANQFRNNIS